MLSSVTAPVTRTVFSIIQNGASAYHWIEGRHLGSLRLRNNFKGAGKFNEPRCCPWVLLGWTGCHLVVSRGSSVVLKLVESNHLYHPRYKGLNPKSETPMVVWFDKQTTGSTDHDVVRSARLLPRVSFYFLNRCSPEALSLVRIRCHPSQ